jgi:hypothetical protein
MAFSSGSIAYFSDALAHRTHVFGLWDSWDFRAHVDSEVAVFFRWGGTASRNHAVHVTSATYQFILSSDLV